MVNTVGSCENINWQKKWIKIKRSLDLTNEQRSIIIGSLLGDGTMRIGKGCINANFKVEHGLEQKQYVKWKYQILKPLVFTEPKLSYRYDEENKIYPKSWWFRTIRHPLLTEIYRRFYKGENYRTGKKIIPRNIIQDIDPLAIAVWIMDDGSYSRNVINISTYSFSLSEILSLQKCIRQLFDVDVRWYRDRDKGYRIYFSKTHTKCLTEIIRPYIIPSMNYKIGSH